MDKRFLSILAALIVIFGGIFIFSQHASDKSGSGSSTGQTSNHVVGDGAKNVTLVEYGDFQCSACEGYEPTIDQVRATYAKDIRFQFMNLPLSGLHPNAFAAARAAEAASLQNKFWEMHDALYDNTNWLAWTPSTNPLDFFKTYAQQLGLDVNKFQSDFGGEQVNSTILADLAAFKKTGHQQATPTFFLDGEYIDNAKLIDQNNRPQFGKFKAVIDAEIAKKQLKN